MPAAKQKIRKYRAARDGVDWKSRPGAIGIEQGISTISERKRPRGKNGIAINIEGIDIEA